MRLISVNIIFNVNVNVKTLANVNFIEIDSPYLISRIAQRNSQHYTKLLNKVHNVVHNLMY